MMLSRLRAREEKSHVSIFMDTVVCVISRYCLAILLLLMVVGPKVDAFPHPDDLSTPAGVQEDQNEKDGSDDKPEPVDDAFRDSAGAPEVIDETSKTDDKTSAGSANVVHITKLNQPKEGTISRLPSPQSASSDEKKSMGEKIDLSERRETLTIAVNKAEFLRFSEQVSEIFVANPDIADVQVDEASGAYIFGRKAGTTTVMVTSVHGKVLLHLNLNITHDLEQLRKLIKKSFPHDSVKVDSTPQGIILSGTVSSSEGSKDIENIAKGFLTGKDKLVNRMGIPSSTQVLLKVKIAEVNRSVLNQFGINWGALVKPKHFMYGLLMGGDPIDSVSGGFRRNTEPITGAGTLNSYGFQYKDESTTLTGLLDALDAENLATVLAEPNLMAVSGEVASFLVGGEIPYPVPQSNNNVTIEFKEYGIRLTFVPTVRATNKISLRVRTEVSELDKENELIVPNILNGTATRVPALRTRRAETSVELGDSQSLAIAGLISATMRNHYDDIPGLADIPVLGALFRSTKFLKDQTELVIIVTPYIVEPISDPKAVALPTDNLKRASNLEMLLFQRLNRENVTSVTFNDAADLNISGHAGFNVE